MNKVLSPFSNHSIKRIFFIFSTLFLLLYGCTDKPSLWPESGISKEISIFELPLSDTNLILVEENNVYSIAQFNDSLLRTVEIVSYQEPKSTLIKEIPYTINQQVVHRNNTNASAFYSFQKGIVKLAGYTTKDTLKPLTIFNNPLVILPLKNVQGDTTTSFMYTWNKEKMSFEKGQKAKSKVQLIKTGTLRLKNTKEPFYLYSLTLSQDVILNYGEQKLILPEAIVIKSFLLYGEKSGLILEWGIRTKEVKKEEPSEQENTAYLELSRYKRIKNP